MNYKLALEKIKEANLYREIKPIEKIEDKYLYIHGKRYLDFSSSNYLGLRDDKRVVEAVKKSLDIYGLGSGASRLVVGNSKVFDDLETKLAQLKNKEKALELYKEFPILKKQVDIFVSNNKNFIKK